MDDAIRKGRATEAAKADLLGRINATADIAALSDCDLVIEAVFEDSAVKRNVIEQAEAAMPAGAILASNTSTIPITSLAGFSARPRQFVGIHFFSPVDRMMLVEIILGRETGEQAVAAAFDYVRAIGKTPVIVNDTRGFFVNRCVLGYIGEAYDMLIEGVPPPMIENAARMAGMPVGPLALNDEIALDLAQKIMKQTLRDLGEGAVDPRHMQLMDAMVDEHGRLGRKNGKGFYDYPPKPAKKRLWPGLASLFPPRAPETFDIEELKQRFLVIIALEAARIMEEGIVTDPREADVGSILAFGFAPYTGGVLSYIDGMGVDRFLAVARSLEAKFGSRFRPPALLAEMAGRGETFHERFRPAERAA
jgi:3-hydroxyacyl-CoA dehydrogenase/enoyl-CoA hydratase/3-hydroxybutyryl-CoA epimerase